MKRFRNISYIASALLLTMALATSCSREDPDDNAGDDVGGKGGNAILKVTPQHHGIDIEECTVYIKYNAQDLPSTFDDSAVCVMEGGRPVATFNNLKKGNYYLYGYGWDPAFSENVDGGPPYRIVNETTLTYLLAVSEEH